MVQAAREVFLRTIVAYRCPAPGEPGTREAARSLVWQRVVVGDALADPLADALPDPAAAAEPDDVDAEGSDDAGVDGSAEPLDAVVVALPAAVVPPAVVFPPLDPQPAASRPVPASRAASSVRAGMPRTRALTGTSRGCASCHRTG
jgi:hypothetical protein